MSSVGTLVLRPDARPGVGAGHISRCLALAQAWARHGTAIFEVDALPESWRSRINAESIEIARPGSNASPEWTAVDTYSPMSEPPSGRAIVMADHGVGQPNGASIVVDQNLGSHDPYDGAPRVLHGPWFSLLRREFWPCPSPPPQSAQLRCAVFAGGAPAGAVIDRLAPLLSGEATPGLEVIPMTGAANTKAVLDSCHLAVAPSGSTVWELCATRTPSVLFSIADNQVPVGRAVHDAGAATYVGPLTGNLEPITTALSRLVRNEERRGAMHAACATVNDGRGARRVVAEMRAMDLRCRPIHERDVEWIWELANDPVVRESSFATAPIGWDEHTAWFCRRICKSDPWFVVSDGHSVIGQVRFDRRTAGRWEIGINVTEHRRRQGLGAPVIVAACRAFDDERREGNVLAKIKPSNSGSASSFRDAGFVRTSDSDEHMLVMSRLTL